MTGLQDYETLLKLAGSAYLLYLAYQIAGSAAVREGEVAVDLEYPVFIPGAVRQQIQAEVERRLDALFA